MNEEYALYDAETGLTIKPLTEDQIRIVEKVIKDYLRINDYITKKDVVEITRYL